MYTNVVDKGYTEIFYKMNNFVFFLEEFIYQNEKNMKEDYLLTTLIIYAIYAFYFDNGMKLSDSYTTKLDHVLQKSIRYKHHCENSKENLIFDSIPASLKIGKLSAITPATYNFIEYVRKHYIKLRRN